LTPAAGENNHKYTAEAEMTEIKEKQRKEIRRHKKHK